MLRQAAGAARFPMHTQLRDHQQQLLKHGYTIVHDVLSAGEVEQLRELVDALYRLHDPRIDFAGLNIERGQPDGRAPQESRFGREFNFATCLLTKHPCMWPLLDREPVLSLIRSVIGQRCVRSSLNSLEPLQGHGHQPLHRDEGPVGPEGFVTANSARRLPSRSFPHHVAHCWRSTESRHRGPSTAATHDAMP